MLAKGTRTLTTTRTGASQSQSTEQAEAVRDLGAVQGKRLSRTAFALKALSGLPGSKGPAGQGLTGP